MAELDARMLLTDTSAPIESVQNTLMNAAKLQGAQNEVANQNYAMQQRNALMPLLAQAYDPNTGAVNPGAIGKIAQVAPDQAAKLSQLGTQQQSAQLAAKKAQFEHVGQQLQLQAQFLNGAHDEQSYQAVKQQAQQASIDVSKLPPNYDPQVIDNLKKQNLTAQQFYAQQNQDRSYNLDVYKANNPTPLLSDGPSGVNLVNPRNGQATPVMTGGAAVPTASPFDESVPYAPGVGGSPMANPVPTPLPAVGATMGASAPAQQPQGGIAPQVGIPGQLMGKNAATGAKLTESQANANLYAGRMDAANQILNTLEDKGVDKPNIAYLATQNAPSWLGGGQNGMLSSMANAVQNPEQQRVEQARLDFMTADLRKQSGASISPTEYENEIKQYFPVVGDSKEVIAQKRAARARAIAGIQQGLPNGLGKATDNAVERTGSPNTQQNRTVVRTGKTADGQKVVQYSDGTIAIAPGQ